jgi:hypothetical protein
MCVRACMHACACMQLAQHRNVDLQCQPQFRHAHTYTHNQRVASCYIYRMCVRARVRVCVFVTCDRQRTPEQKTMLPPSRSFGAPYLAQNQTTAPYLAQNQNHRPPTAMTIENSINLHTSARADALCPHALLSHGKHKGSPVRLHTFPSTASRALSTSSSRNGPCRARPSAVTTIESKVSASSEPKKSFTCASSVLSSVRMLTLPAPPSFSSLLPGPTRACPNT